MELCSADAILRRESQVDLSISGTDAGERYRFSWLPPEPRRVMLLVHGYAEHAGRYDEMAMHFAQRGFAVHAYDQAGFGRTSGPRGHVDRFDRLIDELARFVHLVRLDHPGLATTLVGHSMGGLVVAATMALRKPEVDRVVLSGALLEIAPGGGLRQSLSLGAARVLSLVAPRVGFAAGLDLAGLSRDPDVRRRYEADPLVRDRMSARFAAGMSAMVDRVIAVAEQVERPMLVLHGGQDPLTPVSGSRRLHAALAPAVAQHSRLKIYPELRHEIFNEPERQSVWQDILDWLEPSE